ncbi:unnamed protein product, partial [marine sediment metagenome]
LMAGNDEKPPDRVKALIDTLRAHADANVEAALDKSTERMPHITYLFLSALEGFLGKPDPERWRAMLDYFVSAEVIDSSSADVLYQLKDQSSLLETVSYFWLLFTLTTGHASLTSEAASGKLRQRLNKEHSPMPPPAQAAILASFIAPEKTGEARDAMRRSGLSEELSITSADTK